jgi:hypothetical protein
MLNQNNARGTPGKLKGQPVPILSNSWDLALPTIGRSEIRQKRKPPERVANFTFLRGWAKIANMDQDYQSVLSQPPVSPGLE